MTPAEKARVKRLATYFNLTPEDADKILDYQGGVCAGCGRPPTNKRLAIDHDHATGEIRGNLCNMCNRLLGRVRDNVALLLKLAAYLQNPPARTALGAPRYGLPGRVGTKKQRKIIKKMQKESEALLKRAA